MNSNFFPLLKIEILRFLSSFNTKGKKAAKNPILYFALITGVLCIVLSCTYSWLMIAPFAQAGADPSPVMALFAGLASMLVFMSSMNQARGVYIGDDYDMLSSLPIKKKDIVGSKIIAIFLVEMLFSVLVMIPHGVMVIIMTKNLSCFLTCILLAFTLPIVPIAVALLISLLVTFATAKFKSANIVFSIAYVAIIVGLSAMSMIVSNLKAQQAMDSFSTIGGVLKWINPTYIFVELSFSQSMLFMIAYAGVNAIVLVFSILFLALFFDKLHAIVSSATMKKDYVRKDLKVRTQNKVLVGLEFKRMANSKLYLANSIMGSIMAVLGSTVFMLTFTNSMNKVQDADALRIMNLLFIPMFILIVTLIIGLVNPTTGSINIEGKTFWIMKTLPVDYRKLMRTKLLFSWSLTVPAALIASTIAVIFHHENALEIVFTYLIPIVYVILNSLIGLIIAIHHPKLKWNNENEAVKNSASVVIGLFVDLGVTIAFGVPLIVLSIIFPNMQWVTYVGLLAVIVIAIIPCAIYLHKNFSKRICMMEDL